MSTSPVGLSLGIIRPIIEPLWTPKQAAAFLGVSVDWVYDHVTRREPRLPAIILGQRSRGKRPLIRFRREDLEVWVSQFGATDAKSRVM